MSDLMQAAQMLSAIHGESINEVLGKYTLREGHTLLLVQQMGDGMASDFDMEGQPDPDPEVSDEEFAHFETMMAPLIRPSPPDEPEN